MTERFVGDPSLRFAAFGMTPQIMGIGEKEEAASPPPLSPPAQETPVIPNVAKRSEGSPPSLEFDLIMRVL